ncbi:EVE domain-containing protein [Polaribacter marinivivus]|uniref:EVE domain-containing protein n=1 Tax=Polaribacter marinivivus TaxID=1524260 RepID=A0ABV8R7Y0_9FLAO
MLFDNVKEEHILQAFKDYEEKGLPKEFGPSSTYDLVYENKPYPPKAIMAYANYHAEGRKIERYFKGGLGTDCFNAFEKNGFKIVKKVRAMNENLHKLKQEFLAYWSLEKLEVMTLDEYTDTNRENSFCYWLEHITRDLGSIVGGSSYKFGIYKMGATSKTESATNRTNDGEYAWHTKYGATALEAFNTIKSLIIRIANYAQEGNLNSIDDIDLGNAFKWKIAFLYGNYNCVNMFKLDALRIVASNLKIKFNNKTPISFFHKTILELKPQEEDYFKYCHRLWKQYQERQIDVKKDFAKWLNKNTFDSYRAYLGYTNQSIEEKLVEINHFFDEIDFFFVDPKKVNELISSILFLLSKKERSKNQDFVIYDNKNSNGIPKAILGKNNYIKFLKERFEYRTPNYWIFQGNPNIYDIAAALKAGHLKSWKVAAHKDKIQVGDQIIIWQTGNNAGCYALAEVTSEVSVFEEEKYEQQYYKNTQSSEPTERVQIKILKYLAEDPILWVDIKDNPIFSEFKAGNQGTNFSASELEFNELLYYNSNPNSFFEVKNKFNEGIFNNYISNLKQLVSQLGLNRDDSRVVFSVRNDRLNFIIGQRYAFNLYLNKSKGSYGVISKEKLTENSAPFRGKDREVLYTYFKDFQPKVNEWSSIINAMSQELKRTNKSGYNNYNNIDFQNYVFGLTASAKNNINMFTPINQILYGPPGTGKTYFLKEQLFDKYTSKQTSITKEQHFETVVSNCSWWQVIAIALLDLKKGKVSDIFVHLWVQKKASLSNSKTIRPTLWGQLQSHTIQDCEFVNVSSRQQPLIFNKTEDSYWEILEDEVKELAPELLDLKDSVENYNPDPDNIVKHYEFVTFHQSFAYEDFIEGIKPVLPENEEETADLGYQIEDGVFKKLCIKAKNDPENRYAIFIDEINRGNVSAIFGELITLIELDKRKGEKNELTIKLPYSKKEFSVPSNIDIYGTMNTADRSVEALDTALRRRFEFKEMMPNYKVIVNEEVASIQLSEVLETINQRIELLIDRDHTIGHSYFVGVDTPEKLANAFNNKIVPLLQEYFYGDYGKIGLVLGKGFVERQKNDTIKFAEFSYENANDFITSSYTLNKVEKDTVVEAVQMLLGKKENE